MKLAQIEPEKNGNERKRKMKASVIRTKTAFTIVELLTVITVIAILIGILVPSLQAVRETAKKVKQKSQLHAIDVALDLYRNDTGDYPPSSWSDGAGIEYCGALKLAEAMLGQDLLGQHIQSAFRADGRDSTGTLDWYPPAPNSDNRSSRRPVYLKLENANAFRLIEIYSNAGVVNSYWPDLFVLCDVFNRGNREKKIGMPILYYRANTDTKQQNPNDPNDRVNNYVNNIYNYNDNLTLLKLGVPGAPAEIHPLAAAAPVGDTKFYDQIRNMKVTTIHQPYNAESFILLSAGPDGRYGTPDDIGNFSY
jgi:type II secretory pathway pseudopilin PulG